MPAPGYFLSYYAMRTLSGPARKGWQLCSRQWQPFTHFDLVEADGALPNQESAPKQDCVIVNISASGARFRVSPENVPDYLLVILSESGVVEVKSIIRKFS